MIGLFQCKLQGCKAPLQMQFFCEFYNAVGLIFSSALYFYTYTNTDPWCQLILIHASSKQESSWMFLMERSFFSSNSCILIFLQVLSYISFLLI